MQRATKPLWGIGPATAKAADRCPGGTRRRAGSRRVVDRCHDPAGARAAIFGCPGGDSPLRVTAVTAPRSRRVSEFFSTAGRYVKLAAGGGLQPFPAPLDRRGRAGLRCSNGLRTAPESRVRPCRPIAMPILQRPCSSGSRTTPMIRRPGTSSSNGTSRGFAKWCLSWGLQALRRRRCGPGGARQAVRRAAQVYV